MKFLHLPYSTRIRQKLKKGFTLIELLVVIAIIGILIGIGTASYQRAVKLSRDAKRKTDLEQLRQALETYRSEVGTYPANTAALEPDYITNLPSDPKANTYMYVVGAPAINYALCAALEVIPNPITASSTCTDLSCGETCNYEVNNP